MKNAVGSRITRIIAGIISCLLVSIYTFRVTEIFNVINRQSSESPNPAYETSVEMNNIYYNLWVIGNMWLRNLDSNGRFQGTEEFKNQTIETLQQMGIMVDGKIIDMSSKFDYLVSYGGNSISNTGKSYDEFDADYSILRKNDNIKYSENLWKTPSIYDFNLYETNYGMHYYYLDGRGIALFDFDTTGLSSYTDELGATIYYKTDGSTPLPDEYYNKYDGNTDNYIDIYDENGNHIGVSDRNDIFYSDYSYYEEVTEPVTEVSDDVPRGTSPEYEEGLYSYKNGEFIQIKREDFKQVQLQENLLTIAIQADSGTITAIDEYNKSITESDKKVALVFMDNIVFLVIALILFIFILITGGYNPKEKKFVMTVSDKMFTELPIGMIVLSTIAFLIIVDEYSDISRFISEIYSEDTIRAVYSIIMFILWGLVILCTNMLIIKLKCRSFWKTTFVYHFIATIFKWLKDLRTLIAETFIPRDMNNHGRFTKRFITKTVIFTLGELFIIFVVLVDFGGVMPFLLLSFFMLSGYIVLNLLDFMAISRVSRHIGAINSGDYTPHTEDKYSPAYCMTEKLNNISAGIRTAVDNQVKSERMKIDLVTNVSHDLKTPLTSIISYVDLLSAEEMSAEARDYVKIIENKSQRLKSMVADLFDLAKATSRTDIDVEKIDTVILANQVIADLADKIELSGRQIKTDIQPAFSPIMAEGKKMYRVLQNLIDNALKYSLDGTRIYFTLKNEAGYCIISIKNIASYEMTFSPDEIIERFTRGDESRSTEGNGLGLSIAKSFTEACGGTFDVIIDGDVFTAEVRLPIIM